jgi:hypothetical protein
MNFSFSFCHSLWFDHQVCSVIFVSRSSNSTATNSEERLEILGIQSVTITTTYDAISYPCSCSWCILAQTNFFKIESWLKSPSTANFSIDPSTRHITISPSAIHIRGPTVSRTVRSIGGENKGKEVEAELSPSPPSTNAAGLKTRM